MFENIRSDATAFLLKEEFLAKKPLIVKWFGLVFLTPGFQFAILLRLQCFLSRIPLLGPMLRRILWFVITMMFHSDIDPAAKIGAGLYCPHPFGIVMGGGTVIGRDVEIREGVTLGRSSNAQPRDPVICDRVTIGPGAAILGDITVGHDCVIEARTIVLRNVEPGCYVSGNPPVIADLPARPATQTPMTV